MAGRTRVYVDMVGDLFHPGHVELLRQARSFGDWLVVGVLSDDVATAYERRPIMTLDERVAVIGACRYVDEVVPDAPDVVTSEFLAEHDIAVVVHGDDIADEVIEALYGDVVAAGKLGFVRRELGISTTSIIKRVHNSGSNPPARRFNGLASRHVGAAVRRRAGVGTARSAAARPRRAVWEEDRMSLGWQCLCVDAEDPARLGRWWAELLGWRITHDDPDEVVLEPPAGSAQDGVSPDILFLKVPESKRLKNRLHLDLRPDDQHAEVARAEELGARRVDVGQDDTATWVVMADPEGNEFCILRVLTPGELSAQ